MINFDREVERGVRRIVLMYRSGGDEVEVEADEEIERLLESRKISSESIEERKGNPNINIIKRFETSNSSLRASMLSLVLDESIQEEMNDDKTCEGDVSCSNERNYVDHFDPFFKDFLWGIAILKYIQYTFLKKKHAES